MFTDLSIMMLVLFIANNSKCYLQTFICFNSLITDSRKGVTLYFNNCAIVVLFTEFHVVQMLVLQHLNLFPEKDNIFRRFLFWLFFTFCEVHLPIGEKAHILLYIFSIHYSKKGT